MTTRCAICGDLKTVAKDRCPTCYQYQRRTGTDRSEKLVIRLTERDVERELSKHRNER